MKRLLANYLRHAQHNGTEWQLSTWDFYQLTSRHCHYCGKAPLQKSRHYLYNGIDRMDNTLGYIPSNVVPCCKECNFVKGSRLTHDEMKAVAAALTAFRQRFK